MNKVLKNLQLTFGETAASPKVLTIASVNTLIKAIEDTEVNTKFSGHITSESGSLTAAQAYSLAIAGLSFHGNVTPVDFTLKANKTEVIDGSEIIFTTTGVPTSAIDFIVNNITINSGSIAKEDIENICSIENNKLIIAPAGVAYDWQATIEVKAITKYTPATEKTINIVIKHKAYSSISNQTSVNFDTPNTISIPLSFIPVDANVPIESIRATLENVSAIYQVGLSGNNVNITCNSIDDLVNNKINIEATDVAGKLLTSSIDISNKVTTNPSIVSEDSFIAKNGKGSLQCTFGFNPEKYNVDIEFVSVVSSNSLTNITNASIDGFIINVDGCIEDMPTNITAKIKVDGVVKTITKTINIIYQQIFNEFKVYANSAWVVPTSNKEVKVGDVVAQYIGEGLWMVDESLVDESMDVTAGGVVVGKYGKNEYSDGSEIVSTSQDIIIYPVKDFILSEKIGDVIVTEIKGRKGNSNSQPTGSLYVENKRICNFNSLSSTNTSIWIGRTSSNNITYKYVSNVDNNNIFTTVYYESKSYKNLNQDFIISSTSLIAKNGTLDELITPTTPNTDVVLTGASSSNSVITATIEDDQIKLTGEIADGNPQTSTLTIYYTVNGYSRSVDVLITATYAEVKDDNGHPYVDLGLPSGVLWATCNVGAENPEDRGLYFQWGSINGHAEGSGYNFAIDNYPESGISADLSLSQDAAHANMGGSWRMPTKEEYQELYDNTTWTWTNQGGINGYLVTSKTNGNSIFFPAAGLYYDTSLYYVGSNGYYWSRSFHSSSHAYSLYFNSSNVNPQNGNGRFYGYTVRAVL